jgi:signal transduction histidine kinase
MTDAAHDVVPPTPRRGLFDSAADNPLVRVVGRVPLPLGAKLSMGFAVVAVLLVIGYALGLVALSQSNSRGRQLEKLLATQAYVQQVKADSTRLLGLVVPCGGGGGAAVGGLGCRPPLGNPDSLATFDGVVSSAASQLSVELRTPAVAGSASSLPRSVVRPALAQLQAFQLAYARVSQRDSAGENPDADIEKAQVLASKLFGRLSAIATSISSEAQRLAAADKSSFAASRNLLLGVAGGSLALALGLGLLLSWSVVAPLRRTEERLAEIGAGDLRGRLEVPNRDEIGRLAARVNSTSDELQRVYRELESASRHKSDFLATMSHELRTPLNAIIGFSEVLQEQMFGELNERQLAYVNDVLEAGRHLLSLINDVLDLAKIEAGRVELELSQLALHDILRSAVSIHAERASRAGVDISVRTEPEEITVTADARRLRQIVFNLVSNAVKFTPAEGRVDISARLEDGQVQVAVADTGPGIAAQDIEKIFEEFEQTRAGQQAEGTGLGLPLSRKLVELHGGRLWAESELGRGSTFRFTLPARESPA